MDKIAEAQRAISAASATIRDTISGLESDLDRTKAQLRAVEHQLPPRGEVEARLDRLLDDLAGRSLFGIERLLDGDPIRPRDQLLAAPGIALLLRTQREPLRALFSAALDSEAEARGGWPSDTPEDRQREIERLQFEIIELESALDRATRQAKRAHTDLADFLPDPDFTVNRPASIFTNRPPDIEAGVYDEHGQPIGARPTDRLRDLFRLAS